MSEQTELQAQLDSLATPVAFTAVEAKFIHEGAVFRAGNTYQLEDYAHIDKQEVFMFWRAGWVTVEGWPETPPRNPNKRIVLDIHNIRHLGKSPKLGA